MVGVAQFANVLSFGLGTVPDFDSTRVEACCRASSPRCR